MNTQTKFNWTRIDNDGNGNPRYVINFDVFLKDGEYETLTYEERYKLAAKRANAIGGRKFNTKQYPYGIVFQSYNTAATSKDIIALMK
jgi:hypothetical protein